MKNTFIKNLLFLFFASFLTLTATAQIPKLISYQGILTDLNGKAIADGSYVITVKLFDAETGGTELWSEDHTINTVNGLFAVNLGNNTALDLPFNQAYFASTTFDGEELLPRTALTSSPYAFSSLEAENNKPYALDAFGDVAQEVVFVDSESKIGFGTNIPAFKFHFKSSDNLAQLFLEPGFWSGAGDEAQILLGDLNHVISAENGFGMEFFDVDQFRFTGSSTTFEERVTIGLQPGPGTLHVNGNISVQDDSNIFGLDGLWGFNDLRLFGDPNDPGNGGDMIIKEDGKVGIGLFEPQEVLHINGNLRVRDDANIFGLDGLWGFNDLRLFGDPNDPGNGGDLIIKEDGKVGIGLFEPQEVLHINGNLRLGPDSDIFSIDRLVGDNDLRLFGDPPANGEAEDLFIGADGKVSVGTATGGNTLKRV